MQVEPGTGTRWSGSRWSLRVAVVLAVVVQLLAVNHWHAFPSPAERPRAYQALAVVHRGALDIGPELERWGGSEDVAAFGGRRYPNKAPGLLPLLLPGAAIAHLATPCGSEAELRATLVLGRLLACSLPLWITLALLRRRQEQHTELLAWGWALASPAWAASLLLFSHALTACLLLAGFTLLHGAARATRGDVLAGALLGWAVTCEYPLAVPAAVLVLAAAGPGRWRRWLAVAVGGLLPAAALATYNAACFGSPWSLSSAHEAHPGYASLLGSGAFGIGVPGFDGLYGLVLSPARGLLVWFPLLLLVVAALPWARRRLDRAEMVAGLAGLFLLLLMAGYRNWHGGWFPGPRYLLAVLPLLVVAVAPGLRVLRRRPVGRLVVAVAALWGVAASWLGVASFPFLPEDVRLPFLTLTPPLLADGITFPSWGGPVVWLVAVVSGCIAAAWWMLRETVSGTKELILAAGLAVVALLGTHALTGTPAVWKARLEVAVIRDIYGDGQPRGALTLLQRECTAPTECEQVARWLGEVRRSERHPR
ncbi:MAG: hypothetical protein MUF10_10160 [Thermoanaerobaculaceae bacterium]|jgi:hypothetical protein|nr:hypothetical protein [Thermoanaerobaculaceae bacterium]